MRRVTATGQLIGDNENDGAADRRQWEPEARDRGGVYHYAMVNKRPCCPSPVTIRGSTAYLHYHPFIVPPIRIVRKLYMVKH